MERRLAQRGEGEVNKSRDRSGPPSVSGTPAWAPHSMDGLAAWPSSSSSLLNEGRAHERGREVRPMKGEGKGSHVTGMRRS